MSRTLTSPSAEAVSATKAPALTTALSARKSRANDKAALGSNAKETPSKAAPRIRRSGRLEIPRTPAAPTPSNAPGTNAQSPNGLKKLIKTAGPTNPTQLKLSGKKPRAGMSALDAAAKVLGGLKGAEARDGIQVTDLVERMGRARLWKSPGGKTPAATLYAAMIREMKVKKGESRFTRVSPGHFAFKASAKSGRGGSGQ